MLATYPHLTLLDLHIHAYITGQKYSVPLLSAHSAREYLHLATFIIDTGILPNRREASANGGSAPVHLVTTPLLHSVMLLWRNTSSRHDELRKAVLQLLKPQVSKLLQVDLFVEMMMQVMGFGDDVMAALEEDGLSVVALPERLGRSGVRFGGV